MGPGIRAAGSAWGVLVCFFGLEGVRFVFEQKLFIYIDFSDWEGFCLLMFVDLEGCLLQLFFKISFVWGVLGNVFGKVTSKRNSSGGQILFLCLLFYSLAWMDFSTSLLVA